MSFTATVSEATAATATISVLQNRIKELEADNEMLRTIVSESCAAVGATCRCSTKASIDFMAGVPNEIKMTVDALQYRLHALEDALRLISSGRGLVEDRSTVYMSGRSPVAPKHFNTRDMIEVAEKALEAACK